MKLLYFTCVFSLLLSCGDTPKIKSSAPIKLQIDRVYVNTSGMGEGNKHVDKADHYLILKEYNEEYGGNWDEFIDFADTYRDTVKTTLPLGSITIVKPYDIRANYPQGQGWQEFSEHFLVSIAYSKQTMHEKLADISSLVIWQRGEPFRINLLTKRRMKKIGGYFDSSGKYSDKWWDRYKNQRPVDYEFDSALKAQDSVSKNR